MAKATTAAPLWAACVVVIGCLLVTSAAQAAPVTYQDGLPPALRVQVKATADGSADPADAQEQIAQLDQFAEWARQHKPRVGFLDKLLGSASAVRPVALEDLFRYASSLRGQPIVVSVEGLYEKAEGATAKFRTDDRHCLIELADGAVPEGFGTQDVYGLPVQVEGTIELRGDVPVVRASKVRPALALSLARKGRLLEMTSQHESAIDAYRQVEKESMGQHSPIAAFAGVSVGRIYYDNLRNAKGAVKQYNAVWTNYITHQTAGETHLDTWVPAAAPNSQTWTKLPLRDAIGPTLDKLSSESFWYKFVALFVALCGGNSALGVLLIAVIVRLIIWPLTKKQLESAEAMKRLQPQIKELQSRCADDKQKFQQEFWKLCQANGVNPLGGCLPLLVQMPVLIAVYGGIRGYIVEFDKASFLWVGNLASPDMPLLIAYTISMILFQKMTMKTNPGAAMDPQQEQQQKMMMWMMPVMFFFMFKTFPAAFILYWLGTNIIYFAQQWTYTRRAAKLGPEAPAAAKKQGGFVASMVRALSGEAPTEGGTEQPETSKPEVDRRSMEDIRREQKQDKRGKGRKRK